MTLEVFFFEKKQVLPNLAFFFLVSTFYLISLARGHVIQNWRSQKVQSNIL